MPSAPGISIAREMRLGPVGSDVELYFFMV